MFKMWKLFKMLSQRKKTLVLIIGLGLFLSLIPLHFAQAGVWDDILLGILTIPLRIAAFIIVLILIFIGLVTGLISFVAIAFLGWVKTICLNVPIIYVGVARIGWEFTRDFANMFFILILVFIGLATILRIQEYQAKKTLPLLIIIALLINFSPVLVGFIVDITNIITNFFFIHSGSTSASFLNIFTQAGNIMDAAIRGLITFSDFMVSLTSMLSAMVAAIALIIFYGFATIVYFFVVILLITRIVFLWILVILAPLAFLSYIFPATKKLYLVGWDSWWEELIKWSIIGIPIGFFLYLSNWVMLNQTFNYEEFATAIQLSDPGLSWGETITREFSLLLASMLTPFVALVLLYLGVKFAKKLAPEMAIKVVDGVKKGVKIIAGSALAAATLGAGAAGIAGIAGKAATGAAGAEAALGRVSGARRFIAKPLQLTVGKGAKWATRAVERAIVPPLERYAAKTRTITLPQNWNDMSAQEQEREAISLSTTPISFTRGQKIPGVMAHDPGRLVMFAHKMLQGKSLKDTSDNFKQIVMREGVAKIAKNPAYGMQVGDLKDFMPDYIEKQIEIDEQKPEKRTQRKKQIEEEEAPKLSEEVQKDEELRKDIARTYHVKYNIDKDKMEEELKKDLKDMDIRAKRCIENIAAGRIHTRGINPDDVANIYKGHAASIPVRLASQDWTPENISRLIRRFKPETIKQFIEGPGGLNSIIKTKEDLEIFYLKNRRVFHWLMTAPAARELAWTGRDVMTEKYEDFQERMKPEVKKWEQKEKERKEAEEKEKEEEKTKAKKGREGKNKGVTEKFKGD